MKINLKITCAALLLISSAWYGVTNADSSNVLPQAAFDACSDQSSGDVCSFVNSQGNSINGACAYQGGVEGKLVCVPIH